MLCLVWYVYLWCVYFFFKQTTAYEMRISDWSSDVCSSDLWTASVAAFYVGKSFSDAANTVKETPSGSAGELPDYTLVNARISRDFKLGDGQVLNLGLVANNLFDADYYFRGSDVSPIGRIPGPGRSVIAEASLTF